MNDRNATLMVGNENWTLPVRDGSVGPSAVDITHLYGDTGMFTYDPGFTSTASCESKITYIDGDEGILLYRGYPIEQLAEHGDFLETAYLLRSEEHTSELQSRQYLVCRLLLEKKKKSQ